MKTLLITLLITLGLTSPKIVFDQAQNQDKGMHASWNVLLQKYLDDDRNVDYSSWKKNQSDKINTFNFLKITHRRIIGIIMIL